MELPKRKLTRLSGYDYSRNGAYFITVCTKERKNILSSIIVGEGFPLPKLTTQGQIVKLFIEAFSEKYPFILVDKYVIMPNHIHLILMVQNNGRGNPSPTINSAMGWFKYQTTKEINKLSDVKASVWQRSFYDHIIRDESDYQSIWQYIDENPLKWELDKYYKI